MKHTAAGTPYFTEPHVASIASTALHMESMQPFLESFDLGYEEYLEDFGQIGVDLDLLSKVAGQVCYLSFSPQRTWNSDAGKYLEHIKESGHGSVLEHASVSFLFWGITRSLTHELVRHRAGMSYSQVSQRFCGEKTLRFVERTAIQKDPVLHEMFEQDIDHLYRRYLQYQRLVNEPTRKGVNQEARGVLPNWTETSIVVTGNLRAWRNFIEQRGAAGADPEIRQLAGKVLTELQVLAPHAFSDYTVEDGIISTPYRKV